MRPRTLLPALLTATLPATAALMGGAGPLAPPAGPVLPTHKTMSEVEPRTPLSQATTPGDDDSTFKITQPGSYYLTGNLAGQAGKAGIEIISAGVTIDLGGFTMSGAPGSLDGIRTSIPNLSFIVITNGYLAGWGGDGIDLATEIAGSCRLEGVAAGFCGRSGILAGESAVVFRCTARANNTSNTFNLAGIQAGTGSTVHECTAQLNTGHGIVAGAGSAVSACAAHSNTADGIRVAHGSVVTGCAAHSNTNIGISAPSGPTDRAGNGVAIRDCTTHSNGFAGIVIITGGTVEGCAIRNNGNGILTGGRCLVRGNTCSNNTAAGIMAADTENVVDSNACIANDIGIQVTFAGNLITRNRCSGNSTANWSIVPNNQMGPIVTNNVNTAQITTNGAAPGTLGSADPFANFSF